MEGCQPLTWLYRNGLLIQISLMNGSVSLGLENNRRVVKMLREMLCLFDILLKAHGK